MSEFWILALTVAGYCVIGCAIDYFNTDLAKRNSVLIGYAITLGGALFAAWALDNINNTLIKCAALAPVVFFGRYLMRKYVNRKS